MTWKSWKPADRRRPSGSWRQYQAACRVAGIKHRRNDVIAFSKAVQSTGSHVLHWSLDVRREPTNAYDPNALAVYGCWTALERRWLFWSSERQYDVHIGYVDADMAAGLAMASPDLPIAAELYEIAVATDEPEEPTDFGMVVKIIVLIPSAKDEVWGPTVRLLT